MTANPITPEVLRLSNEAVDAEILKSITEYAELDRQSEKITAKRTKIRTKMEKDHGYSSLAFQEVVRKVKKMTAEERLAHEEQVARGLRVAGVLKQAELWPEMAKKAEARKERARKRADAEAKKNGTETPEQQERRLAADMNPRSDPNRGGAKPQTGKKAGKKAPAKKAGKKVEGNAADRAEETADRNKRVGEVAGSAAGAAPGQVMSQTEREQQEGGDLLETAIDNMKPKSQSAKAAEIREETGVDR